jgi:hypothetical protein
MRKHTLFVTEFLKNYGTKELVDLWNSKDIRKEWESIYIINPSKPKKRCTCYILFCMDKREIIKQKYPYYPPARITSILAEQWRKHKQDTDDVYKYYKEKDKRQAFYLNNEIKLREKYPTLSDEEINVLIAKMYEKYCIKER